MSFRIEGLKGLGRTVELQPGWSIKVEEINPIPIRNVGKVTKHETAHALVAFERGVGTDLVSIVPGTGYLGVTKVGRYDGPTFMAGKAAGCDGFGHDMHVVVAHKEDPETQAGIAKEIMDKNPAEFATVSSVLEARKTITGSEVEWAIDKVRNPEIKIDITCPYGETRQFVTKARKVNNHFLPLEIDSI